MHSMNVFYVEVNSYMTVGVYVLYRCVFSLTQNLICQEQLKQVLRLVLSAFRKPLNRYWKLADTKFNVILSLCLT